MWNRLLSRLCALVGRRRLDDELRDELQFHLDMLTEANRRAGMTPRHARDAALRDFGGAAQHAEAVRDQRWLFIDGVRQDLRHALRAFGRSPVFSVTALLTLAIGIGATTATYSIVYSLLFRPLPLPDGDRLVTVLGRSTKTGGAYMGLGQDVFTVLHSTGAFEAVASWDYLGNVLHLVEGSGRETLPAAEVSSEFFAVAGVQPAIGRAFRDAECREGANDVLVLSHESWKGRFGGDEHIVGRRLNFKGGERTVVGVMPPRFWYPRLLPVKDPEVYYPAVFSWDKPLPSAGSVHFLAARLRRDVSLAAAQAAADVAASRLAATSPDNKTLRLVVVPFRTQMGEWARPVLLLLQAAVLFLLLTAAANVANLALAHGSARQIELAIRSTLGASRRRVVRQILTEMMTLAVAGGCIGVALAWWSVSIARTALPRRLTFAPEVSLDLHVLGVALTLSLAVGLLCGIVPALAATRRDPWGTLAAGGRPRQRGRSAGILQAGLVWLQAALLVVLLAGTGLVLNSLLRVHNTTLGFGYPLERFATIDVEPPAAVGASRADWAALVDGAIASARRVPGVEAAVNLAPTPLAMEAFGSLLLATPDGPERVDIRFAGLGALQALGVIPIQGRLFQSSDMRGEPDSAVVTEGFARRFLRRGSPVGQVVEGRLNGKPAKRTIVGVIRDVRDRTLVGEVLPVMYTPFDVRTADARRSFLVRTTGTAADVAPAVGAALRRAGIRAEMTPLDAARDKQFAAERFYSLVVTAFGCIALALALVGIGGVVAEAVVRRTREIGVRIAVGARATQVVGLVVRQVAVPTVTGILVGVVAATWLTRALRSVLFEVQPGDPVTFAAVVILVAITALGAAWLPARRASRVDPVRALKVE
jgi:putative ABC transport system permease protein